MKKNFEPNAKKLAGRSFIGIIMAVITAFGIVSCDSDEPENENENNDDKNPVTGIVAANELAGKWILVKDNVLYSKVNSANQDVTIVYSGNSAPLYHFYQITVSEDAVIDMVEVSVYGSTIGTHIKLKLEGDNLTALDGKTAGKILHYDKQHSWDNLRIEWTKEYSPISFNAPVVSTYMDGNF